MSETELTLPKDFDWVKRAIPPCCVNCSHMDYWPFGWGGQCELYPAVEFSENDRGFPKDHGYVRKCGEYQENPNVYTRCLDCGNHHDLLDIEHSDVPYSFRHYDDNLTLCRPCAKKRALATVEE